VAPEPGLEVKEGGEGVSLCPDLGKPELHHCRLGHGLHLEFGGFGGEPGSGMRETKLQRKISQPIEPGFRGGVCRGDDVVSMQCQNVVTIS